MDVHRVVLLVVDHDRLGQKEVVDVLENARYPNHCMSPSVMRIDTRNLGLKWYEHHPINVAATQAQAFKDLFPDTEDAALRMAKTLGLMVYNHARREWVVSDHLLAANRAKAPDGFK
jgi:hypothetical protein